jgi:large subunit ribosomal protein L35
MPKMKTNRAAAKRFTKTATGKLKHKKRGLRHHLEHRSKDAKRDLRQAGYVDPRDHALVERLIPFL